jgi:hypothetical protein
MGINLDWIKRVTPRRGNTHGHGEGLAELV